MILNGRLHKNNTFLKILLVFFLINSLSLYFYFRPPSSSPDHRRLLLPPPDTLNHHSSSLKPWPILPSYLPWTNPSPPPAYRSCESFFGNGFSKTLRVLNSSSGGGGWFRCYYSETFGSSVCEGGNLRMDVGKIAMARGGEGLDEVLGRTEDDEMPVFSYGAFEVEEGEGRRKGEKLIEAQDFVGRNKMGELIGSARVVGKGELKCDQVGKILFAELLELS